jgi:hypothetical protein
MIDSDKICELGKDTIAAVIEQIILFNTAYDPKNQDPEEAEVIANVLSFKEFAFLVIDEASE